jgi:hypothetical protein
MPTCNGLHRGFQICLNLKGCRLPCGAAVVHSHLRFTDAQFERDRGGLRFSAFVSATRQIDNATRAKDLCSSGRDRPQRDDSAMREPCAVRVARTVLRGIFG